jgi:hypothetical protein
MQETQYMDAAAAWLDFYERVRPDIWAGLTRNERRDINTAQRDYLGLRKGKDGVALKLGAERVATLLERFAPGRYGVERRVVFWLNAQDGKR